MKIRLASFGALPETAFPRYEFHIRAAVRARYEFDETLYATSGNVVFPNFHAVRLFAQRMNAWRAAHALPAVKAGQINAMGLIDEIFHHLLRTYEETVNPKVFARAERSLGETLGKRELRTLFGAFTREFPPADVHRKVLTSAAYLLGSTAGKPHTEITLEEMILLSLANLNPAFAPYRELFDDAALAAGTRYTEALRIVEEFFRSERPFGMQSATVLELLRAPMLASPNSLEGQLAYIRQHWGLLLGERFLAKLLGAGDLIGEDEKVIFRGEPAPPVVPTFTTGGMGGYDPVDADRFTADLDWMPKVVLLAKNTFVWLEQLSRKYRRPIRTLSEIPDEELDQIARWNFTGLWLIGIWQRSSASQKIKQMTGNPEAVASAYSVYDYAIAAELGGEEAFENLRHRTWARGIRLAGDMVPNHVGIYSRWVVEHPDYFVQSSYRPFPNYQFTGPDLSENPDVDLRIEDGYWSRRDAAVVFQRTDRRNGEVRYLYHGNDGTNMPWNDTAQLNFLRAEVREAVIQTIFHVARKFSIIRFDAAMVLAKKHFQRLWFPEPGTGGAIPSRADHAMSVGEFHRAFPQEFWREVVDRINQEMPNTLLLAEAFWLLEGYFVRTLGMHRVYNSAFMHMLMKEENANYRSLIRNTLHFNPEILKRYVNFMSNPDEQTAVAQFGKDDKYFGVALLLVTLPGLPMVAHGQIEGFAEKYGMEYMRAYHDEQPDEHLIRRHEREIFPIMQKRHLFSQVTHFELYDFTDAHGRTNENVFAYSNMAADERAVVCYHNKYEETSGWIRHSVGKTTSTTGDEEGKKVVRRDLGEALRLRRGGPYYYVFRDVRTGLEYIRSARELRERGLFVELKAFQYHLFCDFRELHDANGDYRQLAEALNGRGVPDVEEALHDLRLAPLYAAANEFYGEPETVLALFSRTAPGEDVGPRYRTLLRELGHRVGLQPDAAACVGALRKRLAAAAALYHHPPSLPPAVGKRLEAAIRTMDERTAATLLTVLAFAPFSRKSRRKAGEGTLDAPVVKRTIRRGMAPWGAERAEGVLLRVAVLLDQENLFLEKGKEKRMLHQLLENGGVRHWLGVNTFEGVTYFRKEALEELLTWQLTLALIEQAGEAVPAALEGGVAVLEEIGRMAERSGYQLEQFRNALSGVRQEA